MQPSASSDGHRAFVTTHWSLVLSAKDALDSNSAESLQKLCKDYWPAVYAYVRRTGKSPADAEDLTQAFFARLLEKDYLLAVNPEKGRFRSFLLTALKRFMANEWDRAHALKRGGFVQVVSIEPREGESHLAGLPMESATPDRIYDRQWAQTIVSRALDRLRSEYIASGRSELFEHVQACLAQEADALSYAQIGQRLNLSEAAVKMAVLRLRSRFRELVRREVVQTVSSPEEGEEELKHLFSAF